MCTNQLFRIENKTNGSVTFEGGNIDEMDLLKKYPFMGFKYRIDRIPCGQCKECRLKYSQEWAFRCMKETKYHNQNWMLTLTYDDEYLPQKAKIEPKTGEVSFNSTLWKQEHQNFMKRLRKHFSNQKLKFFMCGEYGSSKSYVDWKGNKRQGTERPHFHIIIFGLELKDLTFHKYSKCEWSKEQNKLYKSKEVEKCWGKGWVDINEVNYETCAYVARYVMKKIKGNKSKDYYEEKNKLPEYSCCSRVPGIGNQYFYDNIEKFKNGEKHFVSTSKGIKEITPGRYYDKLLEDNFPKDYEKIKQERRKRSEKIMEEILTKTGISHHEYIENQDRKNEKKLKKLIRPLR